MVDRGIYSAKHVTQSNPVLLDKFLTIPKVVSNRFIQELGEWALGENYRISLLPRFRFVNFLKSLCSQQVAAGNALKNLWLLILQTFL